VHVLRLIEAHLEPTRNHVGEPEQHVSPLQLARQASHLDPVRHDHRQNPLFSSGPVVRDAPRVGLMTEAFGALGLHATLREAERQPVCSDRCSV
jgi:hypothetical protein